MDVVLIGNFAGLSPERTFAIIADTLGDTLLSWPDGRGALAFDGDADADSLPQSYALFTQCRDAGRVPQHARLQVNIRLPSETVNELGRPIAYPMLAVVPPDRLSVMIEIDIPAVAAALAAEDAQAESVLALVIARARAAIAAIPGEALVLLHLCCADGARYRMTPQDADLMVAIANRIAADGQRIDLVHIPLPLRHDDDAFVSPLAGLQLSAATRVCLGLVHLSDGLPGARDRVTRARRYLSSFGIAARGSFASRNPAEISPFLRLHRDVLDALGSDAPNTIQ